MNKIIEIIIAIPFIIMLYVIASLCYLTQHIYNLCTGKGWSGMGMYE
jgi:ABC-type methionine transport system permease subunit